MSGLNLDAHELESLFQVDTAQWQDNLTKNAAFLKTFGNDLPQSISAQHQRIEKRINDGGCS